MKLSSFKQVICKSNIICLQLNSSTRHEIRLQPSDATPETGISRAMLLIYEMGRDWDEAKENRQFVM